jgi:hypothetical protein
MKRLTLAVLATAALLASMALAATPGPSGAGEPEFEYLPSVNSMFDGQSGGAFTIPPA